MTTIQNQAFDQERALYGSRELLVRDCAFTGPADGESAFNRPRRRGERLQGVYRYPGGALLF